ncbi:hypothetical protein PYW07_003961 [Mythimna separata]|uniref:Uncharacterized protein n=1 Tax=Mythimna separata TaxID=271217 RepID=A0AAD7YN52_MYTSE|nr:hypothetical protein PYW07_003961 [Mythimna separata]
MPHFWLPPDLNTLSFVSESDDDSEDDEEQTNSVVSVIIPRAYQSLLETPLDLKDAVGDPPAADSVPAESSSDVEDLLSAITHLPRDLFNFNGREFPLIPIRPELRRETFSESNVGSTTPCADPYKISTQIWDRLIMEHIASETNKCSAGGIPDAPKPQPPSQKPHLQVA